MATDTPLHIGGTVTGRQQGKSLRFLDLVQESVVRRHVAEQMARRFDRQLLRTVKPSTNTQQLTSSVAPGFIDRVDYADLEARILAIRQQEGRRGEFYYQPGAYDMPLNPLPKRGISGPLDIPLAWKAALRDVQKLFPTAVLAGGALRDRDHGVKVKDLDIFIESKTPSIGSVTEAQGILKEEGIESKMIDTTQYAEWFGDQTVVGILETKFDGAPPVSLIFVTIKTDESLLGAFDFGLSQIMWDGKLLKKTVAYDSDFRMKRFRLVTTCDHKQLVRRMERWARLKEKYPQHKLDFGVMSPDGSIGHLSDQVVRTAHGV